VARHIAGGFGGGPQAPRAGSRWCSRRVPWRFTGHPCVEEVD
jgi:hypothetical protein